MDVIFPLLVALIGAVYITRRAVAQKAAATRKQNVDRAATESGGKARVPVK
jgi:hypothetical protein